MLGLGAAIAFEPIRHLLFLEPQLASDTECRDSKDLAISSDPPLTLAQHLGNCLGVQHVLHTNLLPEFDFVVFAVVH